MGSFGPAFLQALAGNVAGGAIPGAPTSPVGVVPPENGMSEAVMGFPSVPLGNRTVGYGGGPNPDGSMSVAGGMGPEAEAVVRGFKPKKISFWGALGDQLLKHWGNEPQFEKRIQNKNMTRAMEGFTGDPMEAVRRIAQIPGMEGKAWDLMNQVQDNERMKDVADAGIIDKRERIINRSNQIFGGVNPDGSNWPAIRQLYLANLARNNITDVYVPEEYDPDFMRAQISGGMTFTQQDQARFREIEQARKNANTASSIQRRADSTRQGDIRLNQGQQRIDQSKANAAAGGGKKGGGRSVTSNKNEFGGRTVRIKDSTGNERVIEFSKDGKTAYQELEDGRIVKFDVRNGNLVRVDIR